MKLSSSFVRCGVVSRYWCQTCKAISETEEFEASGLSCGVEVEVEAGCEDGESAVMEGVNVVPGCVEGVAGVRLGGHCCGGVQRVVVEVIN